MPICKKCNSDKNIKSGKVNGKQRCQCKQCGCHFTEGDNRTNEKIIAKKALCVMFYSLGKASFRMLAKFLLLIHPLYIDGWLKHLKNYHSNK